jgi:hypothetical protein
MIDRFTMDDSAPFDQSAPSLTACDFEEFPVDDWQIDPAQKTAPLWNGDWEDEGGEFAGQLRKEMSRYSVQKAN